MYVAFPFQVNDHGRSAVVDEQEHLKQLIEQVLFTTPGERVNRPEFGTGLQSLLFAPLGDKMVAAAKFMVQSALQQHLSELIIVQDVDVRTEDTSLLVAVQYTALRSGRTETVILENHLPDTSYMIKL